LEVKYRLIAEVIKQWRSNSEERALAEAILYMTGLHLTDLQKLSLQEVTNVLNETIRRPEEKGCRCKEWEETPPVVNVEEKVEEVFASSTQQENTEEAILGIEEYPSLEEVPVSFIEAKKLKRGRKPNVQA
jgi:hypothetical protein